MTDLFTDAHPEWWAAGKQPGVREMETTDVWETNAIFDGDPSFMDPSLVLNVLNHWALGGGTAEDLKSIRANGDTNARLYKVRVTISVEDVSPAN